MDGAACHWIWSCLQPPAQFCGTWLAFVAGSAHHSSGCSAHAGCVPIHLESVLFAVVTAKALGWMRKFTKAGPIRFNNRLSKLERQQQWRSQMVDGPKRLDSRSSSSARLAGILSRSVRRFARCMANLTSRQTKLALLLSSIFLKRWLSASDVNTASPRGHNLLRRCIAAVQMTRTVRCTVQPPF